MTPELAKIPWREILDIGLVAYIYYRLILLLKGTRAVPVMYGLVLVIVLYYFAGELGLYTLHWLLQNFLGSLFLVVIILFQRDIRKALAAIGVSWFWKQGGVVHEQSLRQIARAGASLARARIGALVVIENRVPLGDVSERGVEVGAKVTSELLQTLFHHTTPLHDGAVLIREDRIAAAGCILPLSRSASVGAGLGTRHRAAIGITEETDAVCLVVSEERGEMSLAFEGRIIRGLSEAEFLYEVERILGS